MTISQVALSNTFNEFRQTVNNISNTVNAFDTSLTSATLTANTITAANNISAETLTANTITAANNISAGGSLASGILTAGRMPFVTSGGVITNNANFVIDEPTLNITTTGGLTIAKDLSSNNRIRLHSANGSATFAGATFAVDVHGRQIHSVSNNLAVDYSNTWTTARGEDPDQHLVLATGNTNMSHDMAVVNISNGANAYGEFIAYTASGNSENGWVSMGVNSTNYAEGAFGVTKADDAYVLYSAPVGTSESGDLVIGTSDNGTGNKIIFSANGFNDPANNQQMIIHPAQKVAISINTQSSNTTTGALVVDGGIGLRGNLNVGGNVAITGTITLGGGGNTVSTSSLSVDNPMVFLGANNAADVLDLGIIGEYTSSGRKYAGLVRDASDSGVFKLFANNSTRPNNSVDFSDANVAYGTLLLSTVRANGGAASTSNTTGSVIVTGGVGVAGTVNADAVKILATTAAANTTSGALIVAGGVGIAGTLVSANIAGSTGATISSFITDGTLAANNNTTVPTTAAVRAYVASAAPAGGSTFNLTVNSLLATVEIQPLDSGYNASSGESYSYTGRGKYGTNGNCFFHSSGFNRTSPTGGGCAIRPYTINTSTGEITIGTRSDVYLNTASSTGFSTTWMAQDYMSGKTMWYGNSGWPGASTNEFGYCYATIGETGTVSNIGGAIDYASHYRNGTMGCIGAADGTGWYGVSVGYGQNFPPDPSRGAINRWNFTGSTPSSIGVQRNISNTSTTNHVSMQGQHNLNASAVNVGAMAYYTNTSSAPQLRVFDSTLSNFTDYASPQRASEYAFQLTGGKVIHYGTAGIYVYSAYNSRTLVTGVATPSWITGRQAGGSSISWIANNTWMSSTTDSGASTSFICFSINPTTYAITYRKIEFGGQGIFAGSSVSAMVSGPSQQHLVLATNSSSGASQVLVYTNPFVGITGV